MRNYPNSEKLNTPEANVILEFAEWFDKKHGVIDLTDDSEALIDIKKLVYQFLDVDPATLEWERRQMVREASK